MYQDEKSFDISLHTRVIEMKPFFLFLVKVTLTSPTHNAISSCFSMTYPHIKAHVDISLKSRVIGYKLKPLVKLLVLFPTVPQMRNMVNCLTLPHILITCIQVVFIRYYDLYHNMPTPTAHIQESFYFNIYYSGTML